MAAPQRQRSLVIPREHGAWGILLVPMVSGGAVGLLHGGRGTGLVPLAIAALALFWLRTPVESWMGTSIMHARDAREIAVVRRAVLLLSVLSAAALAWLFWGGRNPGLVWIGAAAGIAFLAQAILKRLWRGARTVAQMVGAAGLTATAAAAWYTATGRLDEMAAALWGANLLFAANQIHFVQLRIHAARAASRSEKFAAGRGFFVGQIVSAALLVTACGFGWLGWYAAAAFVPVLARGFAWFAAPPKPLAIHALGKSELAYACLFGILLIAGTALR